MDNNETPAAPAAEKTRIVAAILAIILGSLGIHKFYLGYKKEGLILLLVTVLTCFTLQPITAIIGVVEGIIYLVKTKDDAEFKAMYIDNQKPWF